MIVNEISKSIAHIEDLSVSKFISAVRNISTYEITEKVDGAQILFGIDEYGFYTSRETKGGRRIYDIDEYGTQFSETYMRSAHAVLESVLPSMKSAGLRPGCQVEAEVLHGELPNVVQYSADRNYVIFLRVTEGVVDIDRLTAKLNGQSLDVPIMTPYTPDGKTIQLQEEVHTWEFSRSVILPVNPMSLQEAVMPKMTELMAYMKEPSGIANQSNMVIESTPLNKRPEWCDPSEWKYLKDTIKEKKEEIYSHVNEGLMLDIKAVLVELLLKRSSQFGPLFENGGWIEGAVLRNPTTGQMVKVVDKSVFLTVKDFSWKIRNELREHAKSPETANSFLGKLHVSMATALGHPFLGTLQATNYLKRLGNTTEERVAAIAEGIDLNSVKQYWCNLLEHNRAELELKLNKYEKEKSGYICEVVKLDGGQARFNYSSAIDRRTKEAFAQTFAEIQTCRDNVSEVYDDAGLLNILVGNKLAKLDETILSDVLKSDQYITLLHRLKSDVSRGINITHIKNQVIQSWKKGMKARKHYDNLLSTIDISLNDLIK